VITQIVVAILGPIIPAPLAVAPIVTSLPEILNFAQACLARVSVVIIALAKSSPDFADEVMMLIVFEMPLIIFRIGIGSPIIPVEATSTSCGSQPILSATAAHIETASLKPLVPVQALALPELTTTA